MIAAYGTEGQAFAIPNCVAVSFVAQNTKPLTIMKRVGYHGNDLERIEKLNALSRRICAEVPELAEAQRWLKETVAGVRSYATGIYYLGNFIAAAGFCCVFGGTVRDWLWAAGSTGSRSTSFSAPSRRRFSWPCRHISRPGWAGSTAWP